MGEVAVILLLLLGLLLVVAVFLTALAAIRLAFWSTVWLVRTVPMLVLLLGAVGAIVLASH